MSDRGGLQRSWPQLACGLLLVLHVTLIFHGATRHSATFDEVVFPAAGYSYLTTGDYRLDIEHPPLLKLLTGAAWLGSGLRPEETPGWAKGDQWSVGMTMLYQQAESPGSLLLRARSVVMALSALLGLFVFIVARRLAGDVAAVAALALYSFDPLVIAHAGLATTDLGTACFYFLAAVSFPAALLRGGAYRVLGAGVLLGLALGCKLSSLPLFAVLAALGLGAAWAARSSERTTPIRRAAIVALIAIPVLVVMYGPDGPGSYLRGLLLQTQAISGEMHHPTYAFGRYGSAGWWWYFPAAWLVKMPIPLLLATAAGLVVMMRRFRKEPWLQGVLLLAPALVAATALFSSLNLGLRHVLLVTPFLAVAGGLALQRTWKRGGWLLLIAPAILLWLAAGTLRVHPHELAYANEISGGPAKLWQKLADSNLDWGQDLPALAEEVAKQPLRRLYLGYFGSADPAAHGLTYCSLPTMRMIDRRFDDGPDPNGREWIALSVTHLLAVYDQPHDRFAWLMERPFTAFPGYSIALFDITGDVDAHKRLGKLAMDARDTKAAEPPLRRAIELAPEDGEARADLAQVLAAQRRFPEAVAQCSIALQLTSDPWIRRMCAAMAGDARRLRRP